MKGKLSKMPRAEQWAERICAQREKTVESFMETGRLLAGARKDLPHGEWTRMFRDGLLPFGHRTADRLIAIAGHAILSNETHVSCLPDSWGTLYALTEIPVPVLKNALKDGVITPDMPRKAIKALLPAKRSRHTEPEPAAESFDAEVAIARVVHVIRGVIADWPNGQPLDEFISTLEHEVAQLQALQHRRAS